MNKKTKLILRIKWISFEYKFKRFCLELVFGRWDRIKIGIWEKEHGYNEEKLPLQNKPDVS